MDFLPRRRIAFCFFLSSVAFEKVTPGLSLILVRLAGIGGVSPKRGHMSAYPLGWVERILFAARIQRQTVLLGGKLDFSPPLVFLLRVF